jgi:tripartite-type tricarboxylate transporter receptor subunit TctC
MAATLANLAFKPESDFVHIVQNPFVLVVNPQVPAKTVRELIELARAKPNTINFAHNGTGTLTSLAVELLKLQTAIPVV